MHEGIFFLASITFPKDTYESWLDSSLTINEKALKFPYDYLADSDFVETVLGKKASVKKWLDFLADQNKKGKEFCEFAYDAKTKKFTMQAYLTTVAIFDYWAKAFGLMIASSFFLKAKGYGSFVNDNGLTRVSCFYTFSADKEEFRTHFYDYYDDQKKWLPFKKIWTQKTWTTIRNQYEKWLKKYPKKSFEVRSAGNFGFIDKKGKFIVPPTFLNALCFHEGMAAVQGGPSYKWGFIDGKNKFVIEPIFQKAFDFLNGVARVTIQTKQAFPRNNLYGFINREGDYIIEPQFVNVEDFADDRALVGDAEKKGYIDTMGKFVIPPAFISAWTFMYERALVGNGLPSDQNTRYGYIDVEGKMITPFRFQKAWHFYEGMAPVFSEKAWGFLHKDGTFLMEPCFEQVEYFQKGFAKVKQDGKWGIIDTKGKLVIEPNYQEIRHFPFDSNKQVVFGVFVNGKYGLIRQDGKVLAEPQFIDIKPFQGNYGAVQTMNGKWGYVDLNGEMKIVAQFENCGPFGEDYAFVWQNGLCGIIDIFGQFIVKPTFDYTDAGHFKNGVTYTERSGRYGLITKEGKVLFEPQFEVLQGFGEKCILVKFPKL